MTAVSPQEDVYVAICGAEGVGKTRLVQRLFAEHKRKELQEEGGGKKEKQEEVVKAATAGSGNEGKKDKGRKQKATPNTKVIPAPSRYSYNSVDMIRIRTNSSSSSEEEEKKANNFVLVDSPSALDSEITNGGALFASDITVFVVDVAKYATHFMDGEAMIGRIGKQEGHEVKTGEGNRNKTQAVERAIGEGEASRQLMQIFASGLKHTIFVLTNLRAGCEPKQDPTNREKTSYQRVSEYIAADVRRISKQKMAGRPAAAPAEGDAETKKGDFVFNGAPEEFQTRPQDSYTTFIPFSISEYDEEDDSDCPSLSFKSWYKGPTLVESLNLHRGHYSYEREKTKAALEKPGTRTGFRLQALHAFNISPKHYNPEKHKAQPAEENKLLAVSALSQSERAKARGASPKERYNHGHGIGRGNPFGGSGFGRGRGRFGRGNFAGRGGGGVPLTTAERREVAIERFGKIIHPTRKNYFGGSIYEKHQGTTVLCGRVLSGGVSVGEEVGLGPFPDFHEIPPLKSSDHTHLSSMLGKGAHPIVVHIKSIKWFDQDIETATAGQMVGLAFNTADIERGVFKVERQEKKEDDAASGDEKKGGAKKAEQKPKPQPKNQTKKERKEAEVAAAKKKEEDEAREAKKNRNNLEVFKFSKMTRNLRLHAGITVGRVRDLGLPSQVQKMRLHVLNFAPGGDLKANRKFLVVSGGSSKTQCHMRKIIRVFEPKTGRTVTNGTIMDTIPPNLAAEVEMIPEGPFYVDTFRSCKYDLPAQHLGRVYLLDQHFVVAVAAVLETNYLWDDSDFFLITMVLRRAFPFELVHKLLGYTSKSALKPFGPHAY